MNPLVSAVIPTRNRPDLVCRAVRSALAQTYTNLEIIVVVDGPDPATVAALEAMGEPRLRIVALPKNVGGSEARNTGVRQSKGIYIAFLDDDDEWLPEKIEYQQRFSAISTNENTLVACKFIERNSASDPFDGRILPMRVPDENEPICEYLFCPKKFSFGEGFIQTSTFFAKRGLFEHFPFVVGQKRGQDSTWLMIVGKADGFVLKILPKTMAIFHAENEKRGISTRPDWRSQRDWMNNHPEYVTPRAYSYYLASGCIMDAVQCREPVSVCLGLMWECVFTGGADLKCVFLFAYRWICRSLLRRKGE